MTTSSTTSPRSTATEGPDRALARLEALEADRLRLEEALGVSDAETLIALVASLEAQLVSLYEERDADLDLAAPEERP